MHMPLLIILIIMFMIDNYISKFLALILTDHVNDRPNALRLTTVEVLSAQRIP